jgi:protein gp37
MGDKTGITWTDATWNPIRGCRRVSPGCEHCYAETMAARFCGPGQAYEGLAKRAPARWTGKAQFFPHMLDQPIRWQRPRRIFVNSMSDLFHKDITNEEIAAIFGVMAEARHHIFQVLTKRPDRMVEWYEWVKEQRDGLDRGGDTFTCVAAAEKYGAKMKNDYPAWPLPNVWMGVTAEDQERMNERVPKLLKIEAAVRYVSVEPQLEMIEVRPWLRPAGRRLDWVIIGGESGAGSRPFRAEWAQRIIEDCSRAGVAVFMKQFGENATFEGEGVRELWDLKSKKGGDPAEWPEALQVQEFPTP